MPTYPHLTSMPAPSRRLLVFFVIMLVGFGVWIYVLARPLVRSQTAEAIPGASWVVATWLPDAENTGGLKIDQVAALADAGAFEPMGAPDSVRVLNANHLDGRWFRFRIETPQSGPCRAVLDLVWQNYDRATLYEQGRNGEWHATGAGSSSPGSGVVPTERTMAFDLNLRPEAPSVFYLHVEDYTRLPTQFQFWTKQDDFLRWERFESAKTIGFICLLVPLAAYGLFGYATLHQSDHLHYVWIVVLYILYRLFNGDPFSWGLISPWQEMGAGVIGVLISMGYCGFARSLFSLVRHDLKCDRWVARVQWGMLGSVVFLPLPLWPGTAFFTLMTVSAVLLGVQIFLLFVGIRRWRAGAGQAPFFVLGMGLFIFARVQFLLAGPDVMNRYDEQALISLLSSSVGLLVFAWANAFRHRLVLIEHFALRKRYTTQLEQDVAERTRVLLELSERLKATVAERDRILAIIGHDLRGPASSLQSLTHILAEDAHSFSPEELATLSRDIDRACSMQLELLNNLLAWGGVQAGHARKPQLVNVREMLEAAWTPLMGFAAEKNITLVDLCPKDLRVLTDAALLQTILRNLLANAVKFSRPNGRIEVSRSAQSENFVELAVRDEGIGIEPARLKSLFKGPVESELGTRDEQGAGLGLSLCRDLARAVGGDIQLESKPGKGTTALLMLPAVPLEVEKS